MVGNEIRRTNVEDLLKEGTDDENLDDIEKVVETASTLDQRRWFYI